MKALIAMSGGVDSSAAASLMIERGFECIGMTMELGQDLGSGGEDMPNGMPDEVLEAKKASERLGIPHYVFDFRDIFRQYVVDPFVSNYKNGMTPNPCVQCNKHIKFGEVFTKANELGCDVVATGHYARVEFDEKTGKYLLKKALDLSKDQSYVLFNLTQKELSRTVFPLGEMTKAQARALAAEHGLENANRKESQDICFVPDGDYAGFIESYTGTVCPPGDFTDKSGKVLGRHKGIIRYTIGQHRKLGADLPGKMYVCRLCPEKNTVILGNQEDLWSKEVLAGSFNWILGLPERPVRCKAKVRYRQSEQWATAEAISDTEARILFDEPQRAITPGQSVVLYDGDIVLGGGIIKSPNSSI